MPEGDPTENGRKRGELISRRTFTPPGVEAFLPRKSFPAGETRSASRPATRHWPDHAADRQ
jgi:hypothetical protein